MIRPALISDLSIINKFLFELNIRQLTIDDLNNKLHQYKVYEKNNQVIGLIFYSVYHDVAELDYLYVNNNYRNKKIGMLLLNYFINDVKNTCKSIALEVKIDNYKAINLYKKLGFKSVRIIKNYYKDKDGLLMIKELD